VKFIWCAASQVGRDVAACRLPVIAPCVACHVSRRVAGSKYRVIESLRSARAAEASAPEQLIAADRNERTSHRELGCWRRYFPAAESDRRVTLLSLPLLRTVRATFTAHGSSLSNASCETRQLQPLPARYITMLSTPINGRRRTS
jgi:hypothetical protein